MKRVCTLRKVLRSLSKVLLEKLFYRSYIVAFIATQFLLFLSYLLAGDIHRQQELSGDKKLRHLRTIRTKWL